MADQEALPRVVFLLDAMVKNYGDGPHQWDKLDREACENAASVIRALAGSAQPAPDAFKAEFLKDADLARAVIAALPAEVQEAAARNSVLQYPQPDPAHPVGAVLPAPDAPVSGLESVPRDQALEGWKVGNEFAPFHPDASHVHPDYRDGWNACYRAAAKFFASQAHAPTAVQPASSLGASPSGTALSAPAADAASAPIAGAEVRGD